MLPNIGGTELVIALLIILLLFGAKRIPELARGLGSGLREFRKGTLGRVREGARDRAGRRAGRRRVPRSQEG